MEQETKNNHLKISELTCDIKNIGDVIFDIFIEGDFHDDDYDETLYRIESLAKAVGKCCKDLSKECNKGLNILNEAESDTAINIEGKLAEA
ncbi:MAG: hypothetical protein M0P61_14685 [Ignavibacteriaceae bacterium]|jgi:hypothetical protein|nr:hypothetical protein [Ignavibacteriaceae bacterium]